MTVGLAGFDRATFRPGALSLGGRPLMGWDWRPDHVYFEVPFNAAAGEALLVVSAGGQTAPPAPLHVVGHTPWFAPEPAAGSTDGGAPVPMGDGGPLRPPPDAAPPWPDAGLPQAVAKLSVDPAGPNDVQLVPVDAPPGELQFQIVLPNPEAVWGAALHVRWDPNLVRFVTASPAPNPTGAPAIAWREIAPGRLVLGRAVAGERVLLTLRFAILGIGEGRIDLPARNATFRGPGNVRLLDRHAAGGSVRIVEEAP